ncbi:MAG: hypothetical protein ABEJ04_01000 [Halobacteriaceae archaeon]
MTDSGLDLRRAWRAGGYALLGAAVTAGTALAALYVVHPIQPVIYGAFYLQVGPSEATETAILAHFLLSAVVAVTAGFLAGDYLSTRLANRAALGAVFLATTGVLAAFLVLALARLAAFLTAALVLGAGLVAIPLLLRYRFGVRSGGVPAFAGGVPVAVLLLLLAGFGLGWGWGYVATAREVPASAVSGPAVTFDEAPQFERDLFTAGYCREEADGRRTCSLELRGYEFEVAAARFMARHGVRCPYEGGSAAGGSGSFVARHDGSYYRVTCAPHGD